MKSVKGKLALVTGGASGIGFGMVEAFLAAGMRVVIADASGANLDDARQRLLRIGGEHRLLHLDVTDRPAMQRLAETLDRELGGADVLCNNAGVGITPSVRTATYSDWDSVLNINLGGVINGIVSFLPGMLARGRGGHIVNTASMAAIIPLPDPGALYSTSKFAVRGLSESLRLALAHDHIGVSVLCPGLTRTRILDQARQEAEAGTGDELSAGFVNAQKFALDPRVVGQAVLDAVLGNQQYVLTHAEFIDEVNDLHRELIEAFRTDLPIHPQRADFEGLRRALIGDLKRASRNEPVG